jgi:hypothetical protein
MAHIWVLHGLWLVAGAAGPAYAPHVKRSLQLALELLVSVVFYCLYVLLCFESNKAMGTTCEAEPAVRIGAAGELWFSLDWHILLCMSYGLWLVAGAAGPANAQPVKQSLQLVLELLVGLPVLLGCAAVLVTDWCVKQSVQLALELLVSFPNSVFVGMCRCAFCMAVAGGWCGWACICTTCEAEPAAGTEAAGVHHVCFLFVRCVGVRVACRI